MRCSVSETTDAVPGVQAYVLYVANGAAGSESVVTCCAYDHAGRQCGQRQRRDHLTRHTILLCGEDARRVPFEEWSGFSRPASSRLEGRPPIGLARHRPVGCTSPDSVIVERDAAAKLVHHRSIGAQARHEIARERHGGSVFVA